ncbi:hypothetical protein P8452_02769 [Trifolium repens]|nr:hypothetical protein P8452_02769 [Trifolium repens]
MAEQPKKAILVGVGKRGATTGSLAGTLTDINNWDNLLKSNIYQMSPNDIVRMYDDDYLVDSDKRKPTHPTTYHVISQVKNAYGEIENKGGDVMLMLSCHGTRWPVGLAQNNSSYVEAAMLAEQTLLTDNRLRELSKEAPDGCFLTVVKDSCGKKVGILLSSGQSKEISIENEDGHGGFFTNHLISAIRAKSGLISNRELIVDVTQRMSDVVKLSGVTLTQHPDLYGTEEHALRQFFGGPRPQPVPQAGLADDAWFD